MIEDVYKSIDAFQQLFWTTFLSPTIMMFTNKFLKQHFKKLNIKFMIWFLAASKPIDDDKRNNKNATIATNFHKPVEEENRYIWFLYVPQKIPITPSTGIRINERWDTKWKIEVNDKQNKACGINSKEFLYQEDQ